MKKKNNIWIAWEKQRRSIVLAKEFGCQLYIYECKSKSIIYRYLMSSLGTCICILRRRPERVFCQNPSLVLTLLLCSLKRIFNYQLIVDRHSNFRFNRPKDLFYKLFSIASKITIREADLTIVTNEFLKINYIEEAGGVGAVLPDKIPDMSIADMVEEKKINTAFFVTSFSGDEPIVEFFEAIKNLSDDYYFYISGNYKKYNQSLNSFGSNYELTGFVDENRFKTILNTVDVVIVLTKHEHTLTCGAYEAVSANKPMVLSNTITIRDYFKLGAIYCDPSPESIRAGIIECFNRLSQLQKEVKNLKIELNTSWVKQYDKVKYLICNNLD